MFHVNVPSARKSEPPLSKMFHVLVFLLTILTLARAQFQPTCLSTGGSILIQWNASEIFQLYYVSISFPNATAPFALETTQESSLNLTQLAPGRYLFTVRALPTAAKSLAWGPAWTIPQPNDTIECQVSVASSESSSDESSSQKVVNDPNNRNPQSQFVRAYRISEYSFDPDFLRNHDAASPEAMPLYLQTCSGSGTCTPFDAVKQSPKFYECHNALAQLCPGQRGSAFQCMACADRHRASVVAACGNYSDADSLALKGSFAVHWWCGVGWPESAPVQGTIQEFCVEMLPVPAVPAVPAVSAVHTPVGNTSDGFSDYLSCNSDEVDGYGNDPRDPRCICIVYDDRLLSHQTKPELDRDCYVGTIPWVDETVCNCSGNPSGGELPMPGNPSLTHVGRAPVYLPYVAYKVVPAASYPGEKASGFNYHFPKGGRCPEGVAVGTNGCTWRRLPRARLLYGQDLLEAGWDTAFVPDTLTNQTHTLANNEAFRRAWKKLDATVAADPCGEDE
jgi:hypothetical protein